MFKDVCQCSYWGENSVDGEVEVLFYGIISNLMVLLVFFSYVLRLWVEHWILSILLKRPMHDA